jgi:eukaryotic-like serine/threonine-protein kinase
MINAGRDTTEQPATISELGNTLVAPANDPDDTEKKLRAAKAELERRLHAGEACRAEEFFSDQPSLAADVDTAVDLIYEEFTAREDLGEKPDPQDYLARFPLWREKLERLFAIHKEFEPHEKRLVRITGSDGVPEQYEVERELARSPNCVVEKALHVRLQRLVVIKTLADLEDVTRFGIGAREQSRLHHPNILPVFDIGETEDAAPCFVMEYAEGGSLAGKQQTPEAAARLVRTLAEAMHYAHREGVIHRDLKPANVVLLADGIPKIMDFGSAKRVDASIGKSRTENIHGTPSYMAPEQAAGRAKEVGPLSDVYSLGAILYELLTGKPPFMGRTVVDTISQVLSRPPMRPRRLVRGVPRALESICLKCLEKKPRRRYPSAQALADDLGRWLNGMRPTAHAAWARAGRVVRRHRVVSSIGVIVVLAAIITPLALYLTNPEREREQIERDLAQGKPVTLIGESGAPAWYQWTTNENSQKAEVSDGQFVVESWRYGLLELVHDPQHTHFRITAEIRHERGEEVGLYFAHSRPEASRGPGHFFVTAPFNGCKDARIGRPDREGNEVKQKVLFLTTTEDNRLVPTTIRVGSSAFLPVSALGGSVWRKLAIEVSPQKAQFTVWRESTELTACGSGLVNQRELEGTGRTLEITTPCAPRSPLGLYICGGRASFRNVVICPVPDRN